MAKTRERPAERATRPAGKPGPPPVHATVERGTAALVCALGWAIPGAGHLWLGRRQKGLVFLATLPAMFLIGLALEGRLFPFAFSEPLVGLAAIANLGIGLLYFLAKAAGWSHGVVTAVSYEYGNTFAIVAGLFNMLVVLDALDIARGRK